MRHHEARRGESGRVGLGQGGTQHCESCQSRQTRTPGARGLTAVRKFLPGIMLPPLQGVANTQNYVVDIKSLGINLAKPPSSARYNEMLGKSMFLAVGERVGSEGPTARAEDATFAAIIDSDGVAVNTSFTRRQENGTNSRFYCDGNAKIDGDLIVTGDVIWANSITAKGLRPDGAGGASFWRSAKTDVDSTVYTTSRITVGPAEWASDSLHKFHVVGNSGGIVRQMQMSVNNREGAGVALGVIGDGSYSPAVVMTTPDTNLEFRVRNRADPYGTALTYYDKASGWLPDVTAEGYAPPSMCISAATGAVCFGVADPPQLSVVSYTRNADGVLVYGASATQPRVFTRGALYADDIMMRDSSGSVRRLEDMFFVKSLDLEGLQVDAHDIANSDRGFRAGAWIFNRRDPTDAAAPETSVAVEGTVTVGYKEDGLVTIADGRVTAERLTVRDVTAERWTTTRDIYVPNVFASHFFVQDEESGEVREVQFVTNEHLNEVLATGGGLDALYKFSLNGDTVTTERNLALGTQTKSLAYPGRLTVNNDIVPRRVFINDNLDPDYVYTPSLAMNHTSARAYEDGFETTYEAYLSHIYDRNYVEQEGKLVIGTQPVLQHPEADGAMDSSRYHVAPIEFHPETDFRFAASNTATLSVYRGHVGVNATIDTIRKYALAVEGTAYATRFVSPSGEIRGFVYSEVTGDFEFNPNRSIGLNASPEKAYSVTVGGSMRVTGEVFDADDRMVGGWYKADTQSNDVIGVVWTSRRVGMGTSTPEHTLDVRSDSVERTEVRLRRGERTAGASLIMDDAFTVAELAVDAGAGLSVSVDGAARMTMSAATPDTATREQLDAQYEAGEVPSDEAMPLTEFTGRIKAHVVEAREFRAGGDTIQIAAGDWAFRGDVAEDGDVFMAGRRIRGVHTEKVTFTNVPTSVSHTGFPFAVVERLGDADLGVALFRNTASAGGSIRVSGKDPTRYLDLGVSPSGSAVLRNNGVDVMTIRNGMVGVGLGGGVEPVAALHVRSASESVLPVRIEAPAAPAAAVALASAGAEWTLAAGADGMRASSAAREVVFPARGGLLVYDPADAVDYKSYRSVVSVSDVPFGSRMSFLVEAPGSSGVELALKHSGKNFGGDISRFDWAIQTSDESLVLHGKSGPIVSNMLEFRPRDYAMEVNADVRVAGRVDADGFYINGYRVLTGTTQGLVFDKSIDIATDVDENGDPNRTFLRFQILENRVGLTKTAVSNPFVSWTNEGLALGYDMEYDGTIVDQNMTLAKSHTKVHTDMLVYGRLAVLSGPDRVPADIALDVGSHKDAIAFPVGTESDRPLNPKAGYLRYNSDINAFEGWNGKNWEPLIPESGFLRPLFSGNPAVTGVATWAPGASGGGMVLETPEGIRLMDGYKLLSVNVRAVATAAFVPGPREFRVEIFPENDLVTPVYADTAYDWLAPDVHGARVRTHFDMIVPDGVLVSGRYVVRLTVVGEPLPFPEDDPSAEISAHLIEYSRRNSVDEKVRYEQVGFRPIQALRNSIETEGSFRLEGGTRLITGAFQLPVRATAETDTLWFEIEFHDLDAAGAETGSAVRYVLRHASVFVPSVANAPWQGSLHAVVGAMDLPAGRYYARLARFHPSVDTTDLFQDMRDGLATIEVAVVDFSASVVTMDSIVPAEADKTDLGSAALRWKDAYISGDLFLSDQREAAVPPPGLAMDAPVVEYVSTAYGSGEYEALASSHADASFAAFHAFAPRDPAAADGDPPTQFWASEYGTFDLNTGGYLGDTVTEAEGGGAQTLYGEWVEIRFPFAMSPSSVSLTSVTYNTAPTEFRVVGYTPNGRAELVGTFERVFWARDGVRREFPLSSLAEYTRIRIVVARVLQGDHVALGEVVLATRTYVNEGLRGIVDGKAPRVHTHDASEIVSGNFPWERLPLAVPGEAPGIVHVVGLPAADATEADVPPADALSAAAGLQLFRKIEDLERVPVADDLTTDSGVVALSARQGVALAAATAANGARIEVVRSEIPLVVDSLESLDPAAALSARQGAVIMELMSTLSNNNHEHDAASITTGVFPAERLPVAAPDGSAAGVVRVVDVIDVADDSAAGAGGAPAVLSAGAADARLAELSDRIDSVDLALQGHTGGENGGTSGSIASLLETAGRSAEWDATGRLEIAAAFRDSTKLVTISFDFPSVVLPGRRVFTLTMRRATTPAEFAPEYTRSFPEWMAPVAVGGRSKVLVQTTIEKGVVPPDEYVVTVEVSAAGGVDLPVTDEYSRASVTVQEYSSPNEDTRVEYFAQTQKVQQVLHLAGAADWAAHASGGGLAGVRSPAVVVGTGAKQLTGFVRLPVPADAPAGERFVRLGLEREITGELVAEVTLRAYVLPFPGACLHHGLNWILTGNELPSGTYTLVALDASPDFDLSDPAAEVNVALVDFSYNTVRSVDFQERAEHTHEIEDVIQLPETLAAIGTRIDQAEADLGAQIDELRGQGLVNEATGTSVTLDADGSIVMRTDGALLEVSPDGSVEIMGDLVVHGDIQAVSDRRVKTEIRDLRPAEALEKVRRLQGVSYEMTTTAAAAGAAGVRHLGLIAQEVAAVVPEVVRTNSETGLLSVAYGNMVGLLVEAIKDLGAKYDALAARGA